MFDGIGVDEEVLNSGMHLGNLHDLPQLINQVGGSKKADLNKMLSSELSEVWDFKIWLKIIELQKSFNDRVSPDWEKDTTQEKYNTWYALLDETVEVLNSTQWKWWKDSTKHNQIDWDNVRVEFIDLFHFALSIALQMNSADVLYTTMVSFQKGKETQSLNYQIQGPEFFNNFWDKILMSVFLKNPTLLLVSWVELWYKLGGDLNSFTKEYFVKMALNNVRQEFGYGAKNNYFKMWPDPKDPLSSKKVEDNIAVKYLVKDISDTEMTETSVDEFIDVFRRYYLEYVAI